MPPSPSFDYYAELQVERSATLTEITSAYRRLARIHHPDKNPDNQQEATAIFQRLQLAHETLSDPLKRARYDDGDDDIFSEPDPFDPFDSDSFTFRDPFGFFFFFRMQSRARWFAGAQAAETPRRENEDRFNREEQRQRQEAKEARREAERLRRENDDRIKREEQRQRQEAKEARKKEARMNEALEKRRLRDEESEKQEKRWEQKGAVSKDEKVQSCLHSDLCDKVQYTRKFKCTACSAKRGMTAFECPHCSASLCMLCVKNFSERRKRMEMREQMAGSDVPKNSTGMRGEPICSEPDANEASINEANVNEGNVSGSNVDHQDTNEPTTGTDATKKPKKTRPKTKNTNTGGPSKQTPISGNRGNIKKDNDPALSEVTGNHVAPTSGAPFASDNPYDILAKDDKTTDPADPTGSTHSSTAGQTGGYIRTLSKMPMPRAAILRQAMERFGAVRSLSITNKKQGIAHVDFTTHDGLRRAMAASSVSVSETVNVRVVELKHCHSCGKDGHAAETCRAVPGKKQEPV